MNTITLNNSSGSKMNRKLSSFFATLCCLVGFVFQSNNANAQFAGCTGCVANDVAVVQAELVQLNPAYGAPNEPQYISLPTTCSGSSTVTGYLKLTLSQNATTRYGMQLAGNILINGIYSSTFSYKDADETSSGTFIKVISNTPITYTCGTQLSLQKLFIGWGNSAGSNAYNNSSTCDSKPHCEQLPLKPTDPPIIIVTPLSANFTSIGSCSPGNKAQTYSFNALAAPGGTTGGTPPYTSFSWVIKDASNNQVGTMTGSNPTFNFSTLGTGMYTVELTVTDDNPTAVSTTPKTITVNSCCGSTAPPVLTKEDNCDGTTTITAKDADGNNIAATELTWSNEATTNPISVSTSAPVTATRTVNGCVSELSNSLTPAPKTTPMAPAVDVVDNCGSSVFTITGLAEGASFKWSDGNTTDNPRTVTSVVTLTATQTFGDCTSAVSNSATSAPKTTPDAPTVTAGPFCSADGKKVSDLPQGNGAFKYYDAQTGGNLLAGTAVLATGTYWVSTTVGDCESSRSSVSITVNPTPDAVITAGSQICTGGIAQFSLTATTTNGATIAWSKPAGADGSFSTSNASPTVYTPGPLDRVNGVTVTLTTSLNGCNNTSTQRLTTAPCGPYYSYTQGYYSSTGTSCTPTGGLKGAVALIQYALDNMNSIMNDNTGQLNLGKTGASFTVSYADASKLVSIMPGGGTATKLAGDYTLADPKKTYPPLKNGKISNVLLSQTITLGLNINIQGDELKNLVIQDGYLTTITRNSSSCTAPAATCPNGTISSKKITSNAALMALLKGKTVNLLFNMASAALGGELPPNVSYTDISNAVDVINNLFDGGRYSLGYFSCAKTCSNLTQACSVMSMTVQSQPRLGLDMIAETKSLSVSAYPNPFTDHIRFTIQAPKAGRATLEVYNMLGQKVGVPFEGQLNANETRNVEYTAPVNSRTNLIYMLRMNGEQVSGKLMSTKQ